MARSPLRSCDAAPLFLRFLTAPSYNSPIIDLAGPPAARGADDKLTRTTPAYCARRHGGDYGPPETVAGAVAAVTEGRGRVAVLLVGDPEAVQPEIDRQAGGGLPIKLVPSEGVILDSESPLQALRAKPKASAVVGVGMVKEGIADAFVTMGSTGATMAASALLLGMMEGLERPALGGPIIGYAPNTVFMELGSSIDCRPSQLVDFAALGRRLQPHVPGGGRAAGGHPQRGRGGEQGQQADP